MAGSSRSLQAQWERSRLQTLELDISRTLSHRQPWIFWESGVSKRAFAQEIDTAFLRFDVPSIFATQTETYLRGVCVVREVVHAQS
jgi:hypothetical protein